VKPFVRLLTLAVAVALLALPVCAAPDYTGINQAVTNYFAALDAIAKKLPTVDTAVGTADLINGWALANEIFAHAAENFAENNPELRNQPQPPPEFKAAFERLNRLKTDYPSLPAKVGALGERFKDDVEVLKAVERFQKSLIRLHISGSLQKNETPAPGSK